MHSVRLKHFFFAIMAGWLMHSRCFDASMILILQLLCCLLITFPVCREIACMPLFLYNESTSGLSVYFSCQGFFDAFKMF